MAFPNNFTSTSQVSAARNGPPVIAFNEKLLRDEELAQSNRQPPPPYDSHLSPESQRLKSSVSSLDFGSLEVNEDQSKRYADTTDDQAAKKSTMTLFKKTEITSDVWNILSQRTVIKAKLKAMYELGINDGIEGARKQMDDLKERLNMSLKNADHLQAIIYQHEESKERFTADWEALTAKYNALLELKAKHEEAEWYYRREKEHRHSSLVTESAYNTDSNSGFERAFQKLSTTSRELGLQPPPADTVLHTLVDSFARRDSTASLASTTSASTYNVDVDLSKLMRKASMASFIDTDGEHPIMQVDGKAQSLPRPPPMPMLAGNEEQALDKPSLDIGAALVKYLTKEAEVSDRLSFKTKEEIRSALGVYNLIYNTRTNDPVTVQTVKNSLLKLRELALLCAGGKVMVKLGAREILEQKIGIKLPNVPEKQIINVTVQNKSARGGYRGRGTNRATTSRGRGRGGHT
jgi:hypothetical protein